MKNNRLITTALLVAAVLGLDSCGKNRFNPFNIDTIPEFSVIMDSGETVNTLTLFGAPAVICTFNTGDPNSLKMLSMLQPLYEQYRSKVKFVTISDGEPREDILRCRERHGYTLPFSAQDDATQAHKFSKDVPYIMVINSNMKIVATYSRDALPTMTDIENALH